MSQTFDTNLLVYASHTASPFHTRARQLVEDFAAGPQLVYVLWPVAIGYLRIVTHPRILDAPLTSATALANVDALVTRPHIRAVGELDEFWSTYRRIADDAPVKGNLVPDAHLVALMQQHGIRTIWTRDRDLRRFPGVEVRDPFGEG
jgi:toxin-antitoxin system PIN domain toxin